MCEDRKILLSYNSPIKLGEKMKIDLRLDNSLGYVNDVKALFNQNGFKPGTGGKCFLQYQEKKSTGTYSIFSGEISFDSAGYRAFYITLKLNGVEVTIQHEFEEETAVISNGDKAFWELFVYYSSFETPAEIKGGIMYQIYVDTFCKDDLPKKFAEKVVEWNSEPKWRPDSDGVYRNDQFYGGNIRGIINKLEYIKSLYVNVIYLTPIFKSPSSNKYDIEDYETIDEMFGTWEDVDELHKKANALGMLLVVDCVFNHSSNKCKLLTENREMYDWHEKYTIPKCWWGYSHLVEFNKYSESYRRSLTNWLEKYKLYVDGIRLDVADSLPDFVLSYIRNHFGKYILGEVWKNAVTGEFREFLYGDKLDGVMNYRFPNGIYRYVRWGNYKNFYNEVSTICKLYPKEALDVSPIFLSSHDIPRIPNILVGDFMQESPSFENVWDMEKNSYWFENGIFNTFKFRQWEIQNSIITGEKKKLADKLQSVAVFLQYTLPGIPSIFAGDEADVMGYKDPDNRKPFPWNSGKTAKYEMYRKFGEFRTEYRKVFAEEPLRDLMQHGKLVHYRRGNLFFIVNASAEEVEFSFNGTIVFIVGEKYAEGKVQPYSAYVISE